VLSFVTAIVMFASCTNDFAIYRNFFGDIFGLPANRTLFFLEFIVGFIMLISFILGFINRKCNKISKYLYLLGLIVQVIAYFIVFSMGTRMLLPYYIIMGINIALLLIKPTWF